MIHCFLLSHFGEAMMDDELLLVEICLFLLKILQIDVSKQG